MAKKAKLFQVLDYSFTLNSSEELLACFRARDQKRVVLPREISYPLGSQYYYAWSESSGVYEYLIFKKPNWDKPRGLVFKKTSKNYNSVNSMCDWCHFYGPSDEVGMLSLAINSRMTIGMLLCLDLGCVNKLETLAAVSGRNFEMMAQQVCERIGRFYEGAMKRDNEQLQEVE